MLGDKSGVLPKTQFQTSSYHDLKGLQSLKQGGDSPEALQETARQFEALFIQMVLKSARDANDLISGDNSYFSSQQMKFYQGMMDEQMSVALAEDHGHGGFGIAQALVQQLGDKASGDHKPSSEVSQLLKRDASEADIAAAAHSIQQALQARRMTSTAMPHTLPTYTLETQDIEGVRPPLLAAGEQPLGVDENSAEKRAYFESPEDFVKSLYPVAEKVAKTLGVDPKVMLAQSALETGWGRYMIPREDGRNSFNLFGIKADARWDGESTNVNTLEFRNGQPQQEQAAFRAYGSFEESMRDYADFLLSNPRYGAALQQADNAHAYTQGLQRSGYATDPQYAHKILKILDSDPFNQAVDAARTGLNASN